MKVFEMEQEFNKMIKHGQELIEKLKQAQEPVKEDDENDIGKLCWFWDDDFADKMYGILEDFIEDTQTKKISYYCKEVRWYDHCHRLTAKEVAEITGYKVEE